MLTVLFEGKIYFFMTCTTHQVNNSIIACYIIPTLVTRIVNQGHVHSSVTDYCLNPKLKFSVKLTFGIPWLWLLCKKAINAKLDFEVRTYSLWSQKTHLTLPKNIFISKICVPQYSP